MLNLFRSPYLMVSVDGSGVGCCFGGRWENGFLNCDLIVKLESCPGIMTPMCCLPFLYSLVMV